MSNRDGKRRPRIDWDAAFVYFAADVTRTFVAVADEFGVSDTAVRKHAKADRWNERRAGLHAQAAEKLIYDGVLKPLAERNRETLRLIRRGLSKIESGTEEPKWSDLPALVKLEQLLEGEATDRIAVAQVQPVIVAFIARVARLVPGELDGELARELDWLEGELRALEPGERAA